MTPLPDIVHDTAAQHFLMHFDEGDAVCAYRLEDGVASFTHTEVPPALEGRGIAAALVAHALAWVRTQGHRARPLCSYVVLYMRRHPDVQDLLA
jgi:uncharacterized protein